MKGFILLSTALTLGSCGGATVNAPADSHENAPVIVTQADQIDAAVGKIVTLRGSVENSRQATLLGVDIDSDAPDLRGQPATATGRLERTVVTQAEIDQRIAAEGQFAHRGAGTFYRLVEPTTGQLAKVRAP